MSIALWSAQIILALGLIFGSIMKLAQSVEKLSTTWPWAGQVPPALVKITGVIDLLGALGLILPTLLNIKPRLTSLAAVGVIVLMICASIFHIARGEGSQIGINVFFGLLAAFIAWGRFKGQR